MAHQAWNVYLNGKKIDTVFCSPKDDATNPSTHKFVCGEEITK